VSIQKKSLINTLKSAKKANVVKDDVTVSGATASATKLNPTIRASARKFAKASLPVKKLANKSAASVRLATKFNASKVQ
jgi:hypothetical protein